MDVSEVNPNLSGPSNRAGQKQGGYSSNAAVSAASAASASSSATTCLS